MKKLKPLREQFGLTQAAMGQALGVTQGAVWQYEHGTHRMGVEVARKLIALAGSHGVALTFEDVYEPAPEGNPRAEAAA